jgi:hypothetical protein
MFETDCEDNKYIVVRMSNMAAGMIHKTADDAREQAMDMAMDEEGESFGVFVSDGVYTYNG